VSPDEFLHSTLGRNGPPVFRLGLSASYRPGRQTVYRALDEGLNYFFFFGFDSHMTSVLREITPRDREHYVIACGAYNYIWWRQNFRRALEKRLRQLRTDYIDVFHFLGVMRGKEFPPQLQDELQALKEDGRVRAVSMSTHDRRFAGSLAAEGKLDAMMIRYNAAHRGAEQEIFPYLEPHRPGIVSFTATRWRFLTRRPRRWSKTAPVPTAGECYRFVLSNPNVNVCLTAPTSLGQFEANLKAVRQGALDTDHHQYMCRFGDAVHAASNGRPRLIGF
jgi:aryl-alcohol dehydrogenase-like predicted oxidoreductase